MTVIPKKVVVLGSSVSERCNLQRAIRWRILIKQTTDYFKVRLVAAARHLRHQGRINKKVLNSSAVICRLQWKLEIVHSFLENIENKNPAAYFRRKLSNDMPPVEFGHQGRQGFYEEDVM